MQMVMVGGGGIISLGQTGAARYDPSPPRATCTMLPAARGCTVSRRGESLIREGFATPEPTLAVDLACA